jgi:MoxR-like ATPase
VNSPFKFLDAYTIDDRQAFFGREEEVAALYDMVTRNRLILVYGQSGTGKTSLIQCGLAARFDATDWYPPVHTPANGYQPIPGTAPAPGFGPRRLRHGCRCP